MLQKPTPTAAGIIAEGVYVTYRNGQTALRDTTFTVPTGSITGLVGVNGAGKSTIFKAIMGFVPVAKGEIMVLGQSVKDALKQNLIAYVPQAEEVDWTFPVLVEDVVMMGRYGHMGFSAYPVLPIMLRSATRWPVSTWTITANARSANCQAGSASGSFWRAPWHKTPP
jgi:manganese/iron transport system ATP-binding protein